jgi:ANTAR domain/PAS fold
MMAMSAEDIHEKPAVEHVRAPARRESAASAERALAGGLPQKVGWFRFHFADQRWEWSPEVERMHGYRPGEAFPTTEMVLSHKHPDDQGQVAATLREVVRTGRPFSARHRIIDVQGHVHEVLVVADRLLNKTGGVIGTHGYYVDVTPSTDREHQRSVSEAVAQIMETRSDIEQAKGMLMLIYHIDEVAAFDLLKWRSQECNVKLHAIAEQIVTDFLSLAYSDVLPPRSRYDRLLLTAHERVDLDRQSRCRAVDGT